MWYPKTGELRLSTEGIQFSRLSTQPDASACIRMLSGFHHGQNVFCRHFLVWKPRCFWEVFGESSAGTALAVLEHGKTVYCWNGAAVEGVKDSTNGSTGSLVGFTTSRQPAETWASGCELYPVEATWAQVMGKATCLSTKRNLRDTNLIKAYQSKVRQIKPFRNSTAFSFAAFRNQSFSQNQVFIRPRGQAMWPPPLDLTLFGKKVERTKEIDGMYPRRIQANIRDIRCLQGFFKDEDMVCWQMTSVPCLARNFWMRSFGGDFRGWNRVKNSSMKDFNTQE